MVNARQKSSSTFTLLVFLLLLSLFQPLPSSASSIRPQNHRFALWTLAKNGSPLLPYDPLTSSFVVSDPLPPCLPSNSTTASDFNQLLLTRGPGFVLTLCPSSTYFLDRTLVFGAINQEISTLGYPTNESRAMLVVDGSTDPLNGMATAIAGIGMAGSRIRNVQINGNRINATGSTTGGLMELGGSGTGPVSRGGCPRIRLLIDHVRSFSPRGWSCMHIFEGNLDCYSAVVTNNDIGPCGHDSPGGSWADGISLSCKNSLVENNTIVDPTDGGIVIFGAQGSVIRINTISVRNETSFGGINLVDYGPTSGEYNGTIVENNRLFGGFADSIGTEIAGPNFHRALIKVGIAIGPRTWGGPPSYRLFRNQGATVRNNTFEGSFGYAIVVANVNNFTITGNSLSGNTSSIGSIGPTCAPSWDDNRNISLPTAFLIQPNTTTDVVLQPGFEDGEVNANICIDPPCSNSSEWAYGVPPSTINYPSPPNLFGEPSPSSSTRRVGGLSWFALGAGLLGAMWIGYA